VWDAQAVAVGWGYGADKLAVHIFQHTGRAVPRIWPGLVRWFIPPTVLALLVYNISSEAAKGGYGGYSSWGLLLGWMWALSTWGCMLFGALRPMDGLPPIAEAAVGDVAAEWSAHRAGEAARVSTNNSLEDGARERSELDLAEVELQPSSGPDDDGGGGNLRPLATKHGGEAW
jgi:hypothetical protein